MKPVRVYPTSEAERNASRNRLLDSLVEIAVREGVDDSSLIDCMDLTFKDDADRPEVPLEDRSMFWPFLRFPEDSIREALGRYDLALVLRLEHGTGSSDVETNRGYSAEDPSRKRIYEVVGKLEAVCFYAGHYLSMGLAAGNCKDVFCGNEKKCQALTPGKPCRYPLRARASVEACGLDPGQVAERAGWDDNDTGSSLIGMLFVD